MLTRFISVVMVSLKLEIIENLVPGLLYPGCYTGHLSKRSTEIITLRNHLNICCFFIAKMIAELSARNIKQNLKIKIY